MGGEEYVVYAAEHAEVHTEAAVQDVEVVTFVIIRVSSFQW
jgi:hypothetical protein